MIVRVATLDEEPGARPEFHIWTEQDVAWLNGKGLPEYSQWQPGR